MFHKVKIGLAMFLVFILIGCSSTNHEGDNSQTDNTPDDKIVSEETENDVVEDESSTIENDEPMFELKYDESNYEIIQVDPNGESKVIAEDYPTEPISSPDNKKAIFIDPLEFELLGSLYLFNKENGELTEIIQPDGYDIPKYADWIDEENIAVIIGYGMGTVSVGGKVYIYNIPNDTLEQITFYNDEIEITNLSIENDILKLTGIKFIDDNYMEYVDYEDTVSISVQ